jgi:alpha-tubulin suppressor-like RCC1 family protein
MRAGFAVIATAFLLSTCTERPATAPRVAPPRASISDAVHEGGNAHFYFLPPLVAAPQPTGQFDASLLPFTLVEVCRLDPTGCTPIASFSATGGSSCTPKGFTPPASSILRIDPAEQLYLVNWQTGPCFALDATSTYRIRVLVAGTELGHVDLDVAASEADLKDVNTDEYASLVVGRTLPIKFRIEQGAVFPVGPDGGTVTAGDGRLGLRIPRGALTTFVGITVRQAHLSVGEFDGLLAGTAWDLGPDGLSFLQPVELSVAYDPASLPDGLVDPTTSLVIATFEDAIWHEAPSTVDVDGHRVRGAIFGFSTKAVILKTAFLDATPTSLTLRADETGQVSATPKDARGVPLTGRFVAFESSDPAVAVVDGNGMVKAVAPGAATIRARIVPLVPPGTDPCGIAYFICAWPSHNVPVTVPAPVASVEVSPVSAAIAIGDVLPLTAVLKDGNENVLTGRTIVWSSTDPTIASVSTLGSVQGVAAGSVTIQATSEGKSGTASIIVLGAAPSAWLSVAAGGSHSCGLRTDGAIYCWGLNQFGELGSTTSQPCSFNPNTTCAVTPQLVTGGVKFKQVIAGAFHTCGIDTNGVAYCWGDNSNSQLGVGSTTIQSSAAPLPVAGSFRFTALTAGLFHTCGLDASGAAFCWGNNADGQVGDGLPQHFSADFPHSPHRVLGGIAFSSIAAGGGHTCALTFQGVAYCWGSNFVGQLGAPTPTSCTDFSTLPCSSTPIPVATDLVFTQIVAGGALGGGSQTCALTSAQQAYCWGSNEFGELGLGTTTIQRTASPLPVVGGFMFATLSAGAGHTCAILVGGAPACWGADGFGQAGIGITDLGILQPTPVQGSLLASSIATSSANGHVCAVTTDGAMFCWGLNNFGQAGDGTVMNRLVPVRVRDP